MNRNVKILIGIGIGLILILFSLKQFDILGFNKNILEFNENLFGFRKTLFQLENELNKTVNATMSYGRLLTYSKMGWVSQVDLYNNNRTAIVQASIPEFGNRPQLFSVTIPIGTAQLIETLKEYGIDFDSHPVEPKNLFLIIFNNLILPIIFIGGLLFFFQNSEDFPLNSDSSSTTPSALAARVYERPYTVFDDIAGIDEAKKEFEEIVSFLEEPERYTRVGATIPKGVLLIGPPGTGKTLLAKAIASEARVPFYNVAASEFVEMFVGIGAARVRELFADACENTPSIVFIDEIDAIGRERGAGIGGGNDEREQTLNQLLTEMDGFRENKGVIVVAATNRVDILDPALLRPGRFDRQITLGLPNRRGRINILKIHSKQKSFEENISLGNLAGRTPGFSGADLSNLLNESAILAVRYKKPIITASDIDEAIDRVLGGIAARKMENKKDKKLIAYHEVGHAIVASLLKDHDKVQKTSIVPRGNRKGFTWFLQDDDQTLTSRAQLFARITTILAGRVMEQIVFGETEVTTGASDDLQRATKIARQIVTRYGMSRLGPIALEDDSNKLLLDSPQLTNAITEEVCAVISQCQNKAKDIILSNRAVIDTIVEQLICKETLTGDDLRSLINEYTQIPSKI